MKRFFLMLLLISSPLALQATPTDTETSVFRWEKYRMNFGMEKVFVSFPYAPTVSQGTTTLTAHTYDQGVLYYFMGYYPPVGNVDIDAFFREIIYNISCPPYNLLEESTYQLPSGDWALEYVAYDRVRGLYIKSFTLVTPFNAYTLQTTFPRNSRERYDFFRNSFYLQCECDH